MGLHFPRAIGARKIEKLSVLGWVREKHVFAENENEKPFSFSFSARG